MGAFGKSGSRGKKGRKLNDKKKGVVLGSDSSYYKVEGIDAKMPNISTETTMKTLRCGCEAGDMVWGKVKSHPWWPGHIINEGFAEHAARTRKREGHVLVSFYGDDSYEWFDPMELLPFDLYFAEKSEQTKTEAFVNAVGEAVKEISRREALGLTCNCHNPRAFLGTSIEGFFRVHVNGYKHWGLYSAEEIKRARDRFQHVEMYSFVREMAMMPISNIEWGIDCIKNVATVLAYRMAVFEEVDEPYFEAFPIHSGHLKGVLSQQEKKPCQAPLSKPLRGPKRPRKLMSLKMDKKSEKKKPLDAQGGKAEGITAMAPTKSTNNSKLGAELGATEHTMNRKGMSTIIPTKSMTDKKLEAQVGTVEPSMDGEEIPMVPKQQVNFSKVRAGDRAAELSNDEKLGAQMEAAEPTMLTMKFPPKTLLPSISELKARFVRFGPLHHSATRVYWRSSTCRVVFKNKPDAEAAFAVATQNSSLFGHAKPQYHLRAFEMLTPSRNPNVERTFDEVPNLKHTNAPALLIPHSSQTPSMQVKSNISHFNKAQTTKYGRADASNSVCTSAPQGVDFSSRMLKVLRGFEEAVSQLKLQGHNPYQPLP